MKNIWKIFFLSLILFVCSACQIRKAETIDFNSWLDKMDVNETMYIEFSQNGCPSCREFKDILDDKLPSDAPFYIVNLSEETLDTKEIVKKVREYYEEFGFTPTILKFEEGKLKKSLVWDEGMDLTDWENWLNNEVN